MQEPKKMIIDIGLTPSEADVYLACLELGPTSIFQLSQKVDIPRPTIYLIIKSLLKKDLILTTVAGKRRRFVAENPEKLVALAQGHKNQLEDTIAKLRNSLPQLSAVYNQQVAKPKISCFEGVNGVIKIYEDTLRYPEILVHCMTQTGTRVMGTYLDKYFRRVLRRGIRTREIVSDTPHDKEYQRKWSTSRNTIICIPRKYLTNTDYMLYGNKIAMITYKGDQPVGVVIEDPELYRFEKIHFEILWKAAKKNIL